MYSLVSTHFFTIVSCCGRSLWIDTSFMLVNSLMLVAVYLQGTLASLLVCNGWIERILLVYCVRWDDPLPDVSQCLKMFIIILRLSVTRDYDCISAMLLGSGTNVRIQVTRYSVPTTSGTVNIIWSFALCNTCILAASASLSTCPMICDIVVGSFVSYRVNKRMLSNIYNHIGLLKSEKISLWVCHYCVCP